MGEQAVLEFVIEVFQNINIYPQQIFYSAGVTATPQCILCSDEQLIRYHHELEFSSLDIQPMTVIPNSLCIHISRIYSHEVD